MKTNITLLFLGITLFLSCQKTDLQETPKWNALTFTESQSTDYLEYMNEPHLNISFPSETEIKEIIYKNGVWAYKNRTYVFIAHNWTDKEIILHVYKNNELLNEFNLKPESESKNMSQISIKDFSVSILPTAGEYSFKISVKDSRGITLLNQYCLHNSTNKMIVK
ncbi:MAG: hypothetical protein WCR71_04815 [Bacteroidales bacterium]